jgi:signal transduction histidine kinase
MSLGQSSLTASARRRLRAAPSWPVGGGKMGELIRSMDWSRSPLGPIESWPQSLRATVSLCLASNFPISLAWGPHHVQIYNDGYWPICGEKHPHSMGQDFRECWASAWPVIGDAFERALTGETSFLENQRIFIDRNGYLEETFFTFSFSPIRDETGVAGLFHPVTETTARMLSERRTLTLRDLASSTASAQTMEEACELAVRALAGSPRDLPFVLFYLLQDRGDDHVKEARLIAAAGLARGESASPEVVDLSQPCRWPLAEVFRTGTAQHVTDLEERFGPLICGEYEEALQQAWLLPITPPGCENPLGILVAGVSSRLALNESYRAFYGLLASGVTAEVANARAYEEERKRTEALAEIDRAKTAFFTNISHEFRTPLTLMLGPIEDELAEHDQPLPPARRERLETAHRNSLRLLKLVNTLLDFSRTEAGRTQANYQPTDLAAYTVELAGVFRSAIEKAGLNLVVHAPPLPEPVYVDREMWEKVVLNLLSNACKHTFAGSITVTIRWCVSRVELVVADTGVGIPASELPRLFERFYRIERVKARTHEGTGIGLALVRELVSLHGGTIDVASEEGKGTTFTVSIKTGTAHLPLTHMTAGAPTASPGKAATAYVEEALHWLPNAEANDLVRKVPAASAGRARPRILLVDDNADMRDYVYRLLASRHEVLTFADGQAALAAAEECLPDLILSDIMMPGLDGFALLRSLRTNPRSRAIPVILLSARAGEESAVEGLQAGADDYLTKPFSARELMARVHTHLELAQARRAWALELEHSNRELEAFSYSLSHDLRTPLRAIDGFSKALLDEYAGQLDHQACHYIQRVRTAAQRMSTLINDLLDLTRVSRSPLHRERLDLSGLAHGLAADFQNREPERKVLVEIQGGLSATGDRRLMTTVLSNLLHNAWKHTARQSHPRISFGSMVQGHETVFYVRDNGVGFNMAYAGKLFTPFQRVHCESDFAGPGIGLAMVQRVIARHGGRIWADAAVNAGATFYFTLGEER